MSNIGPSDDKSTMPSTDSATNVPCDSLRQAIATRLFSVLAAPAPTDSIDGILQAFLSQNSIALDEAGVDRFLDLVGVPPTGEKISFATQLVGPGQPEIDEDDDLETPKL